MENNSNLKSIINDDDLVLANNDTYGILSVSTDYSEDVFVPFETWVKGQYGNASRKYKFTANAKGAHINGAGGKYTIFVEGDETVTLHLYNSTTLDEVYTTTGCRFEAMNIPLLEYNQDYHFTFTKAMNSSNRFYVKVDYQIHSSVDDSIYNCYNCDGTVPVRGIKMRCSSYSMNVDQTAHLSYDIYPYDATNRSVTWRSSDISVARVNAATGLIIAKSIGTTTITATTNNGKFVASCVVNVVMTDRELAEQATLCFSLIAEYSSHAYLPPMEYAVMKKLDSEESAIEEQTELLHSIQLLQYTLLENKLVANSPTASAIIARHLLTGEEYNLDEQAEITQDIRDHSSAFDKVWKEYANRPWLELAQLLLEVATYIPYIQIPANLILLAQGVVGKDFTGRQLPWWERVFEIAGDVSSTMECVGFLAGAIKNSDNITVLNKLDDIAKIADDHEAIGLVEALQSHRVTERTLDVVLDSTLINKVKEFRGSFIDDLFDKGNVAMAEVNISGLKPEWYAHSKINVVSDIKPSGAVSNISLKPANSVFKYFKVGRIVRNVDTEYKILSDIANSLGDNTSITGTIKLFTERPPCDSCADVIKQFAKRYENITLEVVNNNHNILMP